MICIHAKWAGPPGPLAELLPVSGMPSYSQQYGDVSDLYLPPILPLVPRMGASAARWAEKEFLLARKRGSSGLGSGELGGYLSSAGGGGPGRHLSP
mgnify:CR=1 FL=1